MQHWFRITKLGSPLVSILYLSVIVSREETSKLLESKPAFACTGGVSEEWEFPTY
jgi:hypothetical protein